MWTTRIWWKTLPASSQDREGPPSRHGLLCRQRGWPTVVKDFGQFTTVWTSSTSQQLDQYISAPCTLVTMGSWELMQHSSGCTIGKGLERMCLCTASIVKCVQSRRLRKQSSSRTISGQDPCPWNSSPWIWSVNYPGPPVAMSMPSQLSVCWLAMCSVFPWRPNS